MPRAIGLVVFAALLQVIASGCADKNPTAPTSASNPPELRVSGPFAILIPGDTAQLTAVRYYAMLTVDQTRVVTWRSSDVTVLSVASGGLALAVSPGHVDVSATIDGLSSSVGITVAATRAQKSGAIDPETANDIIVQNQDIGSANPHPGRILRFDTPIRVYTDPSFRVFADCAERAARTWQSMTGVPILMGSSDSLPRLKLEAVQVDGSRARTLTLTVNLDNSQRDVHLIVPLQWAGMGCSAAVEDTVTHEFGHALGILGHPDWGGVMSYAEHTGVRQPSAREIRMIVTLYSLPLGAHVNADGTWEAW
jgi:hypothetical protein